MAHAPPDFKEKTIRGACRALGLNTPAPACIMHLFHTMVTATREKPEKDRAAELLRKAGLRQTRQRRAVLETVLHSGDHPNAAVIYKRAVKRLPGISLATVYNCLEALAEKRIVNQLNFDNGASRFCPNLVEHVHLLDDANNRVLDVHLKPGVCVEDVFDLPAGVRVERMEACLHGTIPNKKP